ncbi:triphosphoribosyl-dephospho-CoA synthase CitG [Enterococcus sp. AZ109]|uniref:triphosphoribosyl-dephospho-CoA synthase CitG n=1 Tax=Enterococcus sp. AZ109 TaxID=2774634 RepID=UPI003F2376D0
MTDLASSITEYAKQALWLEVSLTPKPGLVDQKTNGAHHDMDFSTFIKSIDSLTPYFQQYFELGYQHTGDLITLFDQLRHAGSQAEKAMLEATNGVNTHKGANFSFAVLLGATGKHAKKNPQLSLPFSESDTQSILQLAGEMTKHLIQKDFDGLHEKEHLTYGERLYLEKGITGIRGEAAEGYPSLAEQLLPFIRANKEEEPQLLLLRSLVYLMSEIEDNNLLHRGGFEALELVQKECKKIHQANLSEEDLLNELISYDILLTKRHLSPGGAADLLALGIYFAELEGLIHSPLGKNV